jgi:uncharacterized lipoprotein YddW (UPF0748 family)
VRALCLAALAAALACGRDDDGAQAPPAAPSAATEPAARRPLALWVLCEGSQRVLERRERIARLIEDARALGATDLFVQVHRGGRAWFDSTLADAAPWRAAREAVGADPLAELLTLAHEAGLSVHAWVNAMSLAGNRDAPIVRELGPAAVAVDQRGRSLLDYPGFDVPPPERTYLRMGTPALWLDPAAPGVAERLAATVGELVQRYPELDGVHLDYMRYPDVLPFSPGSRFGVGLDFGYGEATRARFRAETGLEAPFGGSPRNADAWDAWRRDQVTRAVRLVREAASGVRLSAAVWSYADRAYLCLGQDWRRWLEDGLLDLAVPMTYTLDDRLLRYHAQSFASAPYAERIWLGLGVWLFARNPERAAAQLRLARAQGVAGDSLFSYDAIAASDALRAALVREASGGR